MTNRVTKMLRPVNVAARGACLNGAWARRYRIQPYTTPGPKVIVSMLAPMCFVWGVELYARGRSN